MKIIDEKDRKRRQTKVGQPRKFNSLFLRPLTFNVLVKIGRVVAKLGAVFFWFDKFFGD
jgi:hypothetical protein